MINRKKVEIFCACLMTLVILVSFWNNFTFFIDHMATEDSNLGLALGGFPFSIFLFATMAQVFLEKNKHLAGMIYVITGTFLILFEIVIYILQDFPSLLRLVAMIVLYAASLILGLIQVRRVREEEKKKLHGRIIIRD